MSEKTEQATPKRLRDARKKGQVAKSREIPSVLIILAIVSTLLAMGDFYLNHLKALTLLPLEFLDQPFHQALIRLFPRLLHELLLLLAPILSAALVAALVGNLVQTGMLFSTDPIIPKYEKVDPFKGAQRLFSLKNLMELFKSLLKVTLLTLLVWLVLKNNLGTLLDMRHCQEQCLLPTVAIQVKQLLLYAATGFVLIAAADYFFERYQHRKQLRMSKDEVKREYRETEGNPEIKGKRRQLHQEVQSSVRQSVKNSSAIVTNPSHIAIGLCYRRGETPLPMITVKGLAARAALIIRVAEEENIPVMRQVSLARTLQADTEIGDYIPSELIQSVAEVLRWAEQVNREASQI